MPDSLINEQQNIRRRVLWPLGLTLVVFLLLFLAVFRIYQQKELTRQLVGHVSSVARLYDEILKERADDMRTVIHLIDQHAGLEEAMVARDRERLLGIAEPIFRRLYRDQNYTHFYFHLPDGTNFLRVHKPDRYGDLIDRITLKQARSTGQLSFGAEIGPLGTFTLRTVFPWYHQGVLLGYIELGEEVEPILELIADQSGSLSAVMIKKSVLTRENWEVGQEMLGRIADWDFLPEHVVTATTEPRLLLPLRNFTSLPYLSGRDPVEITLLDKTFRGRFIPLTDAGGDEVGSMLVLLDVNEALRTHNFSTALVTIFCFLFGGGLFFTAYTILGRTEAALEKTRVRLLDEIEKTNRANTQLGLEIGEKRVAEEALRKAHSELERRVVERTAQLDQQKKLLENLITNIPSLVAWKNLDREYIGCNSGYAELAGSNEEGIVGKRDSELGWSPSIRKDLAAIEEDVLTANRPVVGREVTDQVSGVRKHYICSAVPLKKEDGQVFGMVSIMQNITGQMEKQQLLEETLLEARQASDRITGVMRSVDDALFVVDADDRILLMNESAGALLRLNPADVIGKHAGKAIWIGSLREKVLEILRKREGGVEFDFDVGTGENGPALIMQARSSVLNDPLGRYEGMIFLARDVTRDRSMDRLKSDFISVAAHELRTPMATILGFSELLLDGDIESEEDRTDFVRTIHEKADALSRLLDDMLDISRIESGRGLELVIEQVSVEDLFLPVIRQYQKRIPDREFSANLENNELMVKADPEKIAQVLENLLSNAVKYSPGQSRIGISGTKSGKAYHLTVSDNGIGMTPEQISHAFDKFYRGDSADKAVKGTGLGLTIARHIVRQHGGTISLESRPGEGTRIHFTLPLA